MSIKSESTYKNLGEYKEFTSKFNKSIRMFKLYCDCVSFYHDSKSDAVYYKFFLKSEITELEWEINRRYSDFTDYRNVLAYNFHNLPQLPSKTLIKVTSLPELEHRKEELNKFVKVIF